MAMQQQNRKASATSPPPPPSSEEPKREKFRRIGQRRTRMALQPIKLLGNLGNRSEYGEQPDLAVRIIDTLQAAVDELKERLLKPVNGKGADEGFTL